jgi:transcriptional regulator with XRE-family HTH domain
VTRPEKRLGPRWGLGPGRADPEWAPFGSPADVLRYLCDFHCWTHAQLAERRGVRREQVTRWMNRSNELTLDRLTELLEPLGWQPRLSIVRTEDALAALHTDPPHTLLEYDVRPARPGPSRST